LLAANVSGEHKADWCYAASFARQNGSGTAIVRDPGTGSWLAATGTWFHAKGIACGEEAALLQSYLSANARDVADQLEGSFAIAIGDARTRELILISDIIANCACYFRETRFGLAISGSSLLLAALQDFHLDPVALHEFLSTGVIYEDRSIYQEVRKLGPGAITRIAAGSRSITRERYWSPGLVRAEALTGRAATRALWDNLTCAARQIVRVFPRPLCDLTGGYDSRVGVAAFVSQKLPVAVTVSGPPNSADVRVSRGLARMADLKHIYVEPPVATSLPCMCGALRFTDGEYDLAEYARIQYIHERAAADFDASINGSFGEVARGYWWELLRPRIGARAPIDAERVAAARYLAQPFDKSIFRAGDGFDLLDHMAGVVRRSSQDAAGAPNTLQMDSVYLLMRMRCWQGRIASSTNRIWPCISPFMFRGTLEAMLSTSASERRRGLVVSRLLSEFLPQWANYPLEHGYPAAPMSGRNFHRFLPLIGEYANRAAGKLARPFARLRGKGVHDLYSQTRLGLRLPSESGALLDAASARVIRVFDAKGFEAFLERSRSPDFAFDEQWSRVLTLEVALRALEGAGARLLSPSP
jgi:hypothetical protein